MIKTLKVIISFFLYFLLSDLLFIPLRRVPNYNIFLLLLFSLIFFITILKSITAGTEVKRITYGAFSGLLLWSIIGELCPSLRVHPSSILNPISAVDIKHPTAGIYLLILLITLVISYLTGGIKDGLAMMLMVFGSTWSFELYFQNYSTRFSPELLPQLAYILGGFSALILLFALFMCAKIKSPAGKTFWGYWVYFGLVTTLTSFFILPHPMPFGF